MIFPVLALQKDSIREWDEIEELAKGIFSRCGILASFIPSSPVEGIMSSRPVHFRR
jgi:hypothetical protein